MISLLTWQNRAHLRALPGVVRPCSQVLGVAGTGPSMAAFLHAKSLLMQQGRVPEGCCLWLLLLRSDTEGCS